LIEAQSRQIVAEASRCSPHELLAEMEQIWSPKPDMNFEYLMAWLGKGFQVMRVGLWSRYGPAYGGPAIFFMLRHPDGREVAILVSPGKKVSEFIRQNAEEWERNGVIFEKVSWQVR